MPQNTEKELLEILSVQAKNLLRIDTIPWRMEIREFREVIKIKLKESTLGLVHRLREIQRDAWYRAEHMASADQVLHEYYMAVYSETSFLLSACTSESWVSLSLPKKSI